MKYKGFSLVELLTVMAIIAILAGILFPVFSSAREKARAAHCMTNLMELGQSVTMYSQDFDGKLLPCLSFSKNQNEVEDTKIEGYSMGGLPVADSWAWSTVLYPYVRNKKTFICPSGLNEEGSTYELGYAINVNITSGNKFITNGSDEIIGVRPKKIKEINGQSDVYLIADGSPCGFFGSYINGYGAGESVYIPGTYENNEAAANDNIVNNADDAVGGRHTVGYVNVLFLDCHTTNVSGKVIYTEISNVMNGQISVPLNGRE